MRGIMKKEQSTIKKFPNGYCFTTIFVLFVVGCFLGTCYEEILTFTKKGIWESRQGLIYGPFNPVYGIGVIIFVILLGKHDAKRDWYYTYFYCCLLGGATEYILNWAQEVIFHTHSWDYSQHFLNIGGRTTIPFMLFWGILGLFVLKILYPFVSHLLGKLSYRLGYILFTFLFLFMIFDIIVSICATYRCTMRHEGKKPITVIGELCDRYYPDEYLRKIYPNAKIKKEKPVEKRVRKEQIS